MDYPVEEITYKMKFIKDKISNGESLTPEEEEYAKKIMSFMKKYEELCLREKLKTYPINEEAIIDLLVKKKKGLKKIIAGTRSKNKLAQLNEQVKNIEEFIQSGAVVYFKDFLQDHSVIPEPNIKGMFEVLASKDVYLKDPCLSVNKKYSQMSPFVTENYYTGDFRFNRPLIDLARLVLAGDFKIYNALEKRARFISSHQEVPEEIMAVIPEEMLSIDIKDISALIYYGRGRIGVKGDHTFDTIKDDLDILVAIDMVRKGEIQEVDDTLIRDSICHVLDKIMLGKYKAKDFFKYDILRYFDSNTDTKKLRQMLNEKNFNLELLQRRLLEDDLLSKTSFNRDENLFVDSNGELRLDNISLASSAINGEELNDEECLSADTKCLERINYYKPTQRTNIHEFELDKYDVKVLLAIARYKEELKKQVAKEDVKELA